MHNLVKIRKYLGFTQKQLADILGVGQNTISLIENGVIVLTERNRQRLVEKLHVNLKWLTTGEGDMFCDEQTAMAQLPPHVTRLINVASTMPNGVPFYNKPIANAATNCQVDVSDEKPDFRIDFRPFNDCAFYRPVFGDSMQPKLRSGDIVACKKIENREVILFGETFFCLIRSGDENIETLRIIRKHEDPKKVILKPLNTNFDDSVVNIEDIVELYVVIGSIVRFM